MKNDDSSQLQDLLDRLSQGDDCAREQLIAHSYERLRLLVRRIFHQDFPRLEAAHETGSILNETAIRLLKALRRAKPATPADFFSFASLQTRRVLLNLADRYDRTKPNGAGDAVNAAEPLDSEGEPPHLAIWTEFHRCVDQLPEEERAVADLRVYQDFTHAETAKVLGIHEKTVSRLWRQARLKLSKAVPGWDGLLKDRTVPYDA